jgi:hypothetical protein
MLRKVLVLTIIAVIVGSFAAMVYAHTLSWESYNDVLVSNVNLGYRKVEAHIMRHPTNSSILMAAYIDYFAGIDPNKPLHRCRVAVSTDGGATWTDRGYIPLPSGTRVSADPVIAVSTVNNTTTWYVSCVALSSLARDYSVGDVSKVYFVTSTDNGYTWSTPTVIAEASCVNSNNCPIVDKPWIAVYGSNVYLCWAKLDNKILVYSTTNPQPSPISILFKRHGGTEHLIDSGTANRRNNAASDRSVQGCNIAVNSNGIIYIAWSKNVSDTTANILLKRSFDNGTTVENTPQLIASPNRIPTVAGAGEYICISAFGCVIGVTINNTQSGFPVNNFPQMVIDTSNNIHVTWTGYSSTSLTNIMYKKITNCTTKDQSCTISSAVNVTNEGTANKDQFLPSITFSSTNNTVIITALDRRGSLDNVAWRPTSYHCHLNINSCTSSSHWSTSSIGQQSANYDGSNRATTYIGSYYGVTSTSAREAYAVWGDGRTVNVGGTLDPRVRIWFDRTTT